MAQKLKKITLAAFYLICLAAPAQAAFAAVIGGSNSTGASSSGISCSQLPPGGDPTTCQCPNGFDHPIDADGNPTADCVSVKSSESCPSGVVDSTDPTKCVPTGDECVGKSQTDCLKQNPIIHDLNLIINILSGGVALIVVIMIIVGGIQYTIAGDNPSAVTAAKQRITNALIALIAFLLIYGFLQWLIPGGVFS